MISFLNRLISYSFYALFFLVPIVFTQDTSELFELNKMWLTFGLTIGIVGAWIAKMIFEKKFRIQRTPLDIPILLFLISQGISTFISLDPHTSIWGYYSRFNGGLLSLLTYTLLYYAFVSNVSRGQALRYIFTSILSGIVVALWGLPSHFGYDPTCLLFRGTFDVSCWTNSFQPKVRIFSTLGQPDWLSAYLAALIPVVIGVGIFFWEQHRTAGKAGKKVLALGSLFCAFLFYLDFLYARSRAGFAGISISLLLFVAWYVWKKKLWKNAQSILSQKYFIAMIIGILMITFFVGTSVDQLDTFTFPHLWEKVQSHNTTASSPQKLAAAPKKSTVSTGELGGTDSGVIRLFVWHGAIDAWRHYPIFGTGVETFAYAYYLFMPPGHNMTSEFGYLYNKAHNEYLNYLATTGIVGLGTYLLMIGWFLWIATRRLNSKFEIRNSKQYQNTNEKNTKQLEHSNFEHLDLFRASDFGIRILIAGFLASYIGILIVNFFGFSVVIINIFLFLFPGFVFILSDVLNPEKAIMFPNTSRHKETYPSPSALQWVGAGVVGLIAVYMLYVLIVYWQADKAYGLGQNLVNAGDYQSAYQPLHQAAEMRPTEPTFLDELSLDDAVLATALTQQNKSASGTATQLAQEAVAVSDDLTTHHPNVVSFWKTRVRIMYSLAQLNPQYLQDALIAIQKAAQLAPTDAKVSYNLGLVLGQTGHIQEAITTLQNTIKLKRDYVEAYYALGLFYHSAGVDKSGRVINPEDTQKAIDEMHFILNNFGPNTQATDALKAWNAQ